MSVFHLTTRARCDLREIKDYFEQSIKISAAKILQHINKSMNLIAGHPGLGAPADDLALGCRVFVAKNYLIIYREVSDGIVVSRIVHGSRDLSKLTGLE